MPGEVAPSKSTIGTLLVFVGLILLVLTIFMLLMTLRALLAAANLQGFQHTEYELVSFEQTGARPKKSSLVGKVISTGEEVRTPRDYIVGLDRLLELQRTGKVRGYRVPVWYLPAKGLWVTVDEWIIAFRLQSEDEFPSDGFPAALFAMHAVFAGLSVASLRRGVNLALGRRNQR